MKKQVFTFLAALLIFSGLDLSAQGKYGADSANCIKYLSYYKEYYKQKNYDEAYPLWRKAYLTCPPTANQTMLVDGTQLLRLQIKKNSKNGILRTALIDTLITLHDTRAQYYPKYAATALNNKGLDLIQYIQDDPQTLYEGCSSVISQIGVETKPNILLFALNSSVSLYRDGAIDADEIIENYGNYMALLDKMEQDEPLMKIRTAMEETFISSKVASCDNLITLFTPRFEEDPDNIELVTKIAQMMGKTEGCTDNDLFMSVVVKMNQLQPSYNSAYLLYKLNAANGSVDAAIDYLREAIAFEDSDAAQDADFYYELAAYSFKNGRNVSAFDAALQAAKEPSLAGKAYMICGSIWGSLTCGGNEIERRAPYWVAVDYLNKAKAADPSLASDASSLIRQYSEYFPQTAEAFMYDLTDGQSYRVSCSGLTATTTVRTQK